LPDAAELLAAAVFAPGAVAAPALEFPVAAVGAAAGRLSIPRKGPLLPPALLSEE